MAQCYGRINRRVRREALMAHTLNFGFRRPGAALHPVRPERDSLTAMRAIILWSLASIAAFWTPLLWLLMR